MAKMNQEMYSKLQEYAKEVANPLENKLNEIEKVILDLT